MFKVEYKRGEGKNALEVVDYMVVKVRDKYNLKMTLDAERPATEDEYENFNSLRDEIIADAIENDVDVDELDFDEPEWHK